LTPALVPQASVRPDAATERPILLNHTSNVGSRLLLSLRRRSTSRHDSEISRPIPGPGGHRL